MKQIPQRMCVCCRTMKPKKELFRVVRQEGSVVVDVTGKMNGRGAYVCRNEKCINLLKKNKGLERALGCVIDASVFEQIEKEILDDSSGGK